MAKFKVGDICIVHSLRYDTHYNGCEVSIVEVGQEGKEATHGTLKGMSLKGTYRVDMKDDEGCRVVFLEYNLKIKPLPSGEKEIMRMFSEPKNKLTDIEKLDIISSH